MPGKFEPTRARNSQTTTARKRVRYGVAVAAVFTCMFVVHSWTTSADASSSQIDESRRALDQLTTAIKDDATAGGGESDSNANTPVSAGRAAAVAAGSSAGAANGEKATDATNVSAKIVTCPACRLNALPSVKKFVHMQAKFFSPKLKVDFKVGEDPVLHLLKDGKETKIPLDKYKWDDIVRLLVKNGIKPTGEDSEVAKVVREMKTESV